MAAVAILAVALSALHPGSEANVVVAAFSLYATPIVIVRVDQPVIFVNADPDDHDVVATDARRPDGSATWCFGREPGGCPLFWSDLVSQSTTEVKGLEDADRLVLYAYTCSRHSYMTGEIIVLPS